MAFSATGNGPIIHTRRSADDRTVITSSWSGCSTDTKSAAPRISVLGSRDYRGRLPICVRRNSLVFDELALDMTVRKRSHRIGPHTEALKGLSFGRPLVTRSRRNSPIRRLGPWWRISGDHLGQNRKRLADYELAQARHACAHLSMLA